MGDGDNDAASVFNCVKSEEEDDVRLGGDVEQLNVHKADTLDEGARAEAMETGVSCSLSSTGAEPAAAILQPTIANISTPFRSKTAVPLHSYISASCDQSSVVAITNCKAAMDLAYSSHLPLATNGMSLFYCAPDAAVRAHLPVKCALSNRRPSFFRRAVTSPAGQSSCCT